MEGRTNTTVELAATRLDNRFFWCVLVATPAAELTAPAQFLETYLGGELAAQLIDFP
jgi:hypothetical protein